MMSIVKRVEAAVEQALKSRQSQEAYLRAKEFVADARERGLVVQKTYDLPLVDTIGRTPFNDAKAAAGTRAQSPS